jgi:tetratricopeptide (TPR) repeat protein
MARQARRLLILAAAPAVLALAALVFASGPAAAQFPGVTLPPDGGNQRATVNQGIGLVRVSVDYSSPHVHSPSGEDRRGKIWGEGADVLIPYGMHKEAFGTCHEQCPWRGGANENTVFTTSHDIKVQGQPLAAGSYGLHFVPGRDEWTVIFSKNHTSWGSFFYDAKEDALRVKAKPAKGAYHEDLTYGFRDRRLDKAALVLSWEDLELPLSITVDNSDDLYVEALRHDLRSSPGFTWQGWNAAAQFCLTHKSHLDEGLRWAEQAVDPNGSGQPNFTTLVTLAELQDANGRAADAKTTRDKAFHDPTAGPVDLHQYARQLLAQKKPTAAMEVFELNAKLHPDTWPVHLGLARGHAALGHQKEALEQAKLALPQAPDDNNRRNVQQIIKRLEAGKSL